MSLKELTSKEYVEWKCRMQEETNGVYILIYLGFIFSTFISCMYGFEIKRADMVFAVLCAINMAGVYQAAAVYLSYVRENNVRVNIFEKYIYASVDKKKMILAKMLVVVRLIAIPVISGQSLAVIIRIVNPDKDCGSLSDITVWTPIIVGIIFVIEKYIEFMVLCRLADKK